MTHWQVKIIFMSYLLGCSDKEETPLETDTQSEQVVETDTGPEEVGPNIWSGTRITFEKEDDADPADPANQDPITELVILTRGNRGSLYNVVTDTEDSANSNSPEGTEWAMGTTDALDGLEFKSLKAAANQQMQNLPGNPIVLHLIDEDIYIDVTFLSWSSGGSGGGFSYERSTPN